MCARHVRPLIRMSFEYKKRKYNGVLQIYMGCVRTQRGFIFYYFLFFLRFEMKDIWFVYVILLEIQFFWYDERCVA